MSNNDTPAESTEKTTNDAADPTASCCAQLHEVNLVNPTTTDEKFESTTTDSSDLTVFYSAPRFHDASDEPTVEPQNKEYNGGVADATAMNEEKPTVTEPIIDDENRLIVYIGYAAPLQLIQVYESAGSIPIDSSWIKTEEVKQNSNYQLKVSIQMRKTYDTYVLKIQKVNEPSIHWKCILNYLERQISSTIERDYSDAIKGASHDIPSSPDIIDSSVINILLIGRSQVGKSTLIESLIDPKFSSSRTGISQTREPSCKILNMKSKTGQEITLNIIDTPGLREVRHHRDEQRTDEQLLALLQKVFNQGRIRSLNIIFFVSVIGKTYQNDIDTFKSLIDFFGQRFKSISALVLTHCDKLSQDRIDQLTNDLKNHPKCADVVDYCQLGIHHHGTLDIDDLNTLKGDLRELILNETLERLEPMQKKFIDFILSRSGRAEKISQRDLDHFGQDDGHSKRRFWGWLCKHEMTCSIL